MTLLLTIFAGATILQLLYWLGIFSKLAFYKTRNIDNKKEELPVSVIICARNEATNLRNNLHHFLNQTYRSYEIIVVNDNSSDKTIDVVLEFQGKSPNLRLVNIKGVPTLPGKKAALTKGIEAAIYNLILLTDADCVPSSPNWIRSMQSNAINKIEIVLGFSPYIPRPGFLNLFIRYEAVFTAIQYLSFALLGIPYMGVGRNLLYKRTLFFRKEAFSKHAHIASGDDDLFINEAAIRTNTKINLSPEAFVFSLPKSSWRGYYHQKTRHLSTSTSYKLMHQLMLGGYSLSHFLHYLLAIPLILAPEMNSTVLLLILVRVGVVFLLCGLILKKLKAIDLLWWIPILDAIYVLYYIIFAPTFLIGKKNRWK